MIVIWKEQALQPLNWILQLVPLEARRKGTFGSTMFKPKVPKAKKSILKLESTILMCSTKLLILFLVATFNYKALSTGIFYTTSQKEKETNTYINWIPIANSNFSGKARRGDGNDLTANPKKLAAIGKELDQLSKVINDLTPVSEQPFGARTKSRKEKNKLASRACRLKKKAQHEANKLKCKGLQDEHSKSFFF